MRTEVQIQTEPRTQVTDEFVKRHGKPLVVAAARRLDAAMTPGRSWSEIHQEMKDVSTQSKSGQVALEMFKRFAFLLAAEHGYEEKKVVLA